MKFHALSEIFPLIVDEDLQRLADDIKANGQREPIVLYEDKILDGRNRWKACKLAGTEPKTTEYRGNSPLAFVISLNLHRRHLTASQRACVAVDIEPLLAKEAKARLVESGKVTGRGHKKVVDKCPQPSEKSRDAAGAALDVSGRHVSRAKDIKEKAPEIFEQVKDGLKTIGEANREIRKAEIESRPTPKIPSTKFRVIYADPPWSYNDKCDAGSIQSGGAEKHYPSMTISELCEMPVCEMAEDDAVLFLWVTSPLLFECERMFKAWGFNYKASFVWDKIKHNMGHYNSVRHEFLLLCTRGSCTPDVPKLFDSVQSIERTEHSVKPEAFRDIIDTIYPNGERIELFARRPAKGWKTYGNEC